MKFSFDLQNIRSGILKSPASGTNGLYGSIEGEHEIVSRNDITVALSGWINDYSAGKSGHNKVAMNSAEALLERFINSGIESICSLDGKFSAIIETPVKFYILRDYIGTGSPVFYSKSFISNSFSQIIGVSGAAPDFMAVTGFLKDGFIPAPNTGFSGISKLGPGEYLEYDKTRLELIIHSTLTWQDFTGKTSTIRISIEEAVSQYAELHKNAVLNRLGQNNEAAILLSGGFDSGGNLSATRDVFSGRLTAYSIGFEEDKWSELPYAAIMARKFDAEHKVFTLKESDIEDLPKLISHTGDLFFENGMMLNYLVSREVGKDNPTVVLGGDGNDQLFGTTGRELALFLNSSAYKFDIFQKFISWAGGDSDKLFRFVFHNRNILEAPLVRQFGFSNAGLANILSDRTYISNSEKELLSQVSKIRDFDQLYFWRNFNSDIMQSAFQVIIHKAVSMSGLFNVNLTFPYMDKQIYDFVGSLPREYKFKGSVKELIKGQGTSKYLFKKYVRDSLPPEVVNRKKQGGFAPLSIFLANPEMRGKISGIILDSLRDTGMFREEGLKSYFNSLENVVQKADTWFWHRQSRFNQVFNLLVLALWWNINVKGDLRSNMSDYLK